MSDFEQWAENDDYAMNLSIERDGDGRYCDIHIENMLRGWNAAITSMQGEAKKLHMVEPDHRLIGCANCGSHDVGAGNTTAHCYGCKGKVHGENIEDTIEKWNKKQLATLSTRSAARIAEQDARIKELEQQLSAARNDAERYRLLRDADLTVYGTPRIAVANSEWSGTYMNGDDADSAIDAAIRQIGGAE